MAELPPEEPLLLFDEIHKYARWRNLLKGIYDTEKSASHSSRDRPSWTIAEREATLWPGAIDISGCTPFRCAN
jgi:predicted AAA+ superfamily ATPase